MTLCRGHARREPAREPATYRLELPRWDRRDLRGRREVWEVLHANQRGGRHWGRRQRVTNQVITTVATLARNAGVPASDHLIVELVWVPERANRSRDADNLWPLLKVCCDALARGPAKRTRGRPGLDLVPDDTPAWMTKRSPRIADPDDHDPGLWLYVTSQPGATMRET